MNRMKTNFRKNWKRLLGWLLAALLLLMMFVESRPIDPRDHNQVLGGIAAIGRYDAELGETVLKQHFHLLNNFDALTAVSSRLQGQLRELKQGEALLALRDEQPVWEAFERMEARMHTELDMLERFKSNGAVLRNSLLYLPQAMDDALRTSPPAVLERVGEPLRRLHRDIAGMTGDASSLDPARLRDDIAVFRLALDGLPERELAGLTPVLRHLQQVSALGAEATQLMRELTLTGQQAGMADGFAAAYDAYYRRE